MKDILVNILEIPIKTILTIIGMILLFMAVIPVMERKAETNKKEIILLGIVGIVLIVTGLILPTTRIKRPKYRFDFLDSLTIAPTHFLRSYC